MMLHLAEVVKVHEWDAFYPFKEWVKEGDVILWIRKKKGSIEGFDSGTALMKDGAKLHFRAIKTRRLN